ncbi:MAG: TraR/DksA C4-type zinc finger protein [Desulfocapsa sp.]|nr:TraR/DksA C4-type zinc finger protein [Desulfocapsa sp.]
MTKELNLGYFKNRLQERYESIQENQEARKRDSAPVELDQARVGRLSRMDAMQQQAMSQASARLVEIEQQRIRTALNRIKSGEYGYCILCDEKIAEKRLNFDPSLLTCISCAQEAEKD